MYTHLMRFFYSKFELEKHFNWLFIILCNDPTSIMLKKMNSLLIEEKTLSYMISYMMNVVLLTMFLNRKT